MKRTLPYWGMIALLGCNLWGVCPPRAMAQLPIVSAEAATAARAATVEAAPAVVQSRAVAAEVGVAAGVLQQVDGAPPTGTGADALAARLEHPHSSSSPAGSTPPAHPPGPAPAVGEGRPLLLHVADPRGVLERLHSADHGSRRLRPLAR
jgi:hypothetical protein